MLCGFQSFAHYHTLIQHDYIVVLISSCLHPERGDLCNNINIQDLLILGSNRRCCVSTCGADCIPAWIVNAGTPEASSSQYWNRNRPIITWYAPIPLSFPLSSQDVWDSVKQPLLGEIWLGAFMSEFHSEEKDSEVEGLRLPGWHTSTDMQLVGMQRGGLRGNR